MKQTSTRRSPRQAFTLIELLVVMAIITILISLLTSAVVRALIKAEEVRTRNEISQLASAGTNFQTKFNVDYFPSQFVLCETLQDYQTGAASSNAQLAKLYTDSYQYLTRVWPRIDFTTAQPAYAPTPTWQGIDWNGDGLQSGPVILTGDQCLVFFLGGVQTSTPSPGCLGFANDGKNPAHVITVNGNVVADPKFDRVAPFYEFQGARLVQIAMHEDPTTGQLTGGANGYFSYLDTYGSQPFAYFSSYKTANGYNRYGSTDCPTLNQLLAQPLPAPSPYNDGTNYFNQSTFQIICAGRDLKFGPGGLWAAGGAVAQVERDDMASFTDTLLGN